jgi:hypothetical protein
MSRNYDWASQTFGYALAGLTGTDVKIEVHGTRAYTDGTTIVLPADGLWATGSARARFGVAAHECAHVYFKSVPRMHRLVARYAGADAARAQRAYNAVIDVADETRLARALPGAEELFAEALHHSLCAGLAAGGPPVPTERVPEEQLLALGIMWVRAHPGSPARSVLAPFHQSTPGLREVAGILERVIDSKPASRFRPDRTAAEWRRLRRRTAALVKLLARLYPPGSQPPPGAAGNGPPGAMDESFQPWGGPAKPGASAPAGTQPASGTPAPGPPMAGHGTGPPSPFPGGVRGAAVKYQESVYHRVFPSFRRTVAALLHGPTMTREDGHRTGRLLGKPHRSATDGRCFRRTLWDDGPGYAIAVVVDQSESMQAHMGVFLPVAEAFADALTSDPLTEVGVWRFGSWVERVPKAADLRAGTIMGKTATHLAVREAGDWLAARPARRRVLVVFTDGKPDDPPTTAAEVVRRRRSGIDVLVGSIGVNRRDCANALPGAVVFDVEPNKADSSLHAALLRLRRRE